MNNSFWKWPVAAFAVFCILVPCGACAADISTTIGLKFWSTRAKFDWPDSCPEVKYDGPLIGPYASIDLPRQFWISGHYLQGKMDYEDSDKEVDLRDIEFFCGYSWKLVDVGIGFRDWYSDDDGREYTLQGPAINVSAGDTFGESPVGWYGAATWLFKDLKDDWDAGEHINGEAGLFASWERLVFTLGYRIMYFYDMANDLQENSVTASAGFTF